MLFGASRDAPGFTPITIIVVFLLLIFEYLFVREIVTRKQKAVSATWTMVTIIALSFGLIPEYFVIWMAAILWAIVVPLLVIYMLVLAYILFTRYKNKAR